MIKITIQTAMHCLYALYESKIRLEGFNESQTFQGKYDEEIYDLERAIAQIGSEYEKLLVDIDNFPSLEAIEREVREKLGVA